MLDLILNLIFGQFQPIEKLADQLRDRRATPRLEIDIINRRLKRITKQDPVKFDPTIVSYKNEKNNDIEFLNFSYAERKRFYLRIASQNH